jgi:hypothetical protein
MIRAMLTTEHPLLGKEMTVGHIDIGNDQTGDEELSHHEIQAFRRARDTAQSEPLCSGRLENFERGELSYYDLVHQSLNAVAGDGFHDTSQVLPMLKVAITQLPTCGGQPKLQGLIRMQRLKGGSKTAARYLVELFATGEDGKLKVFRCGELRNFDTTANGYFDLLRAGLNASVKDGFFRRSRQQAPV